MCGKMVEASIKVELLLGLPEDLEVVSGDITEQVITLTVMRGTARSIVCPLAEADLTL